MSTPPSAKNSGARRPPAAIIPAAGSGTRMGDLKPLLPCGGRTVIERVIDTVRQAGVDDIRVVVGHRAREVASVVEKAGAGWVENPRFAEGMLSSIRAGLAVLPPVAEAFFVLPSDICLVRTSTLAALLDAWASRDAGILLYPTFAGQRGHPPLIPRGWSDGIRAYTGIEGLRGFLLTREADAQEVPVTDEGILFDMDTPEDYRRACRRAARVHIPSDAECDAVMRLRFDPDAPVIAHCREVARIAGALCDALNRAGCRLDVEMVVAAARVHDLAKGLPDHATAGRRLLESLGFPEVAALVGEHMDLQPAASTQVAEKEVLYLADKLVQGDTTVDLRSRFDGKLRRHGGDPVRRAAITRRRDQALAVAARIEVLLDEPLLALLARLGA